MPDIQLIETHAHIYDEVFDIDRPEMLQRAKEQGIEEIWMPNCNSETIESMMALATEHPHFCKAMIGLHPCYVKEDFEKELAIVEDWLSRETFIAIGEIGMDLYWDKTFVAQQEDAFLYQCRLAKKYNLWIDIHSRDAFDETVRLIEKNADPNLRGIFHCFTGTLADAQRAIDLGFKLGIGGVATFKNGGLDKVLPFVDIGHLVIETDSPYLAPVPYRGKRNEVSYTALVAQRIAELKGMTLEEVAQQTTQNARNLLARNHSTIN
jgi:TatD DNase family protein